MWEEQDVVICCAPPHPLGPGNGCFSGELALCLVSIAKTKTATIVSDINEGEGLFHPAPSCEDSNCCEARLFEGEVNSPDSSFI